MKLDNLNDRHFIFCPAQCHCNQMIRQKCIIAFSEGNNGFVPLAFFAKVTMQQDYDFALSLTHTIVHSAPDNLGVNIISC